MQPADHRRTDVIVDEFHVDGKTRSGQQPPAESVAVLKAVAKGQRTVGRVAESARGVGVCVHHPASLASSTTNKTQRQHLYDTIRCAILTCAKKVILQDISHPSFSLYHLLPLHVIHLSCLGSEQPHGLHVLSRAPKNIVPLLITS